MTEAATLSLSEIDALCKKAARGAGCPWGLSEEAGKAARWLASHGLPGPEALAALLDGPRDCGGCGCGGAAGPGCGLRLGAGFSDRAGALNAPESTGAAAGPLLILAQAGMAARALNAGFAVESDGFHAVVGPAGLRFEPRGDLLSPAALVIAPSAAPSDCTAAETGARPVDAAAFAALTRLAHKTYAPATEASRRAGAGAGLMDND